MRTWTLIISITAHATMIAAVIVAPIFATTDLPAPRRALTFEPITAIQIPPEPRRVQPRPAQAPVASPSIPIAEPIGLPPIDQPVSEPARVVADTVEAGSGIAVDGFGLVSGSDPVPPPDPPATQHPLRVGGVVRPPTRVTYVAPVYPPLAIASKVEGVVILDAVIDEQGVVREVRILRAHPLLRDAAVHAVTQWRFTPTLLNEKPVPVAMTVTVAFTLKP
jgi:protein TonB